MNGLLNWNEIRFSAARHIEPTRRYRSRAINLKASSVAANKSLQASRATCDLWNCENPELGSLNPKIAPAVEFCVLFAYRRDSRSQ